MVSFGEHDKRLWRENSDNETICDSLETRNTYTSKYIS